MEKFIWYVVICFIFSAIVAGFPADCLEEKPYLRWILGIYTFLIVSNVVVWGWVLSF
jgi:hypothetical protein